MSEGIKVQYESLTKPVPIKYHEWPSGTKPLLHTRTMTFNHEKFINKCIDGILNQKTKFPVKVLIHDDASTDKTSEILRDYEKRFPDLIKVFYQEENSYSKSDKIKRREVFFSWRTGKYEAICEGDDYWTDPNKLQRQVDFLESHNDYSAVAENGIWNDLIKYEERLFNTDPEHDLSIEEMIIKRRFPTASVMYRMSVSSNYTNEINKSASHDTLLWCYLARKGKFRYLTNISSVYNRGLQGVVESTDIFKWAKTVEKWNYELIRLFGNDYYNIEISYNNIWQHYWNAFISKYDNQEYIIAHKALIKCYGVDYTKTRKKHIKMIKNRIKNSFWRRYAFFKNIAYRLLKKKEKHPDFFRIVKKSGITNEKRKPKIIVSLASYPGRIEKVHLTINTLLNQSIKPDLVIIWLSEIEFPKREHELPKKLTKLKRYGLSIQWCKNFKSYNKLVHTLTKYPNDILITADDDLYYRNNWLEKLVSAFNNSPDMIHCHRAHKVLIEKDEILPYRQWEYCSQNKDVSFKNFFTTGAGVILTKSLLHPDVTNSDLFLKLSPKADDIWFWAMSVKQNTKISIVSEGHSSLLIVNGSQEEELGSYNFHNGGNDIQLKNVLTEYPDIREKILENK